jgi:hypothetical protein
MERGHARNDAADTKPVFAWGDLSGEPASIRGVALPPTRMP